MVESKNSKPLTNRAIETLTTRKELWLTLAKTED